MTNVADVIPAEFAALLDRETDGCGLTNREIALARRFAGIGLRFAAEYHAATSLALRNAVPNLLCGPMTVRR